MEPETSFYLLSYHGGGGIELLASIYLLSFHDGAGAWNRRRVFTCFRTTVAEGYGTFSKYLPALVPRRRGTMVFFASIHQVWFHFTGSRVVLKATP